MRRFTQEEMRRYWKTHSSVRADLDYNRDPDGLQNVCNVGAPLWVNLYYARWQKRVYEKLFCLTPPPSGNARALDVGCGAGRWCKLLSERGYRHVVGIDIQPELIKINRSRYSDCEFYCISIQDYHTDEPFDLISSVTVIQHIPSDDQKKTIEKLRGLIKPGGFAIVLENIHDQGPHVFANTIEEWQKKFHDAGFTTVAMQRYDYNPLSQVFRWIWLRLPLALRANQAESLLTPESVAVPPVTKDVIKVGLRSTKQIALMLGTLVDKIVEPVFVSTNIKLPSGHCGFLFKAV